MGQPTKFGKYFLLEKIAIGGMAEVYLANSTALAGVERFLIIKKILPHLSKDEEFITMFIDEAKIASSLNHSNIVQIYELGKEENSYYIAMEFIHGKDLSKIRQQLEAKQRLMPIPLAVLICSRLCAALEYAHRKTDPNGHHLKIIHRDVSPGNVLISYSGEVKLIDFGIAKARNRIGRTAAGILKGKTGYMSPEQVRGFPLDRRSDIFSVGIILYELTTGTRLFSCENEINTIEKIRAATVTPPSDLNPQIPERLERVIHKALAREVSERHQWPIELQQDLAQFLPASTDLPSNLELSNFMREIFAGFIPRENQRMQHYRHPAGIELNASAQFPHEPDTNKVTAAPDPSLSQEPTEKKEEVTQVVRNKQSSANPTEAENQASETAPAYLRAEFNTDIRKYSPLEFEETDPRQEMRKSFANIWFRYFLDPGRIKKIFFNYVPTFVAGALCAWVVSYLLYSPSISPIGIADQKPFPIPPSQLKPNDPINSILESSPAENSAESESMFFPNDQAVDPIDLSLSDLEIENPPINNPALPRPSITGNELVDSEEDNGSGNQNGTGDSTPENSELSITKQVRSTKKALGNQAATGFLIANTTPWSRIWIDDRDTGLVTPVPWNKKIPLLAGSHKVVFKTSDGRELMISVEIETGKTVKIVKKIP